MIERHHEPVMRPDVVRLARRRRNNRLRDLTAICTGIIAALIVLRAFPRAHGGLWMLALGGLVLVVIHEMRGRR